MTIYSIVLFRFTPAFLTQNDTSRFHGFNERMSVDNFAQVSISKKFKKKKNDKMSWQMAFLTSLLHHNSSRESICQNCSFVVV